MPVPTIYTWIYRSWITACRAPGTKNWIITADEQHLHQLRQRRARPPGYYGRVRYAPPGQEISIPGQSTHATARKRKGSSGARPPAFDPREVQAAPCRRVRNQPHQA